MNNKINIPNLIYLEAPFYQDWADFNENVGEDIERYTFETNENICKELKISIIQTKFVCYGWHGFPDELPFNIKNNIQFDPSQISVIIPQTNNSFRIVGENRRIILTHSKTYQSKKSPFYIASCSSESQLENIRVLDFIPGKPFYGLEKAITERGFYQLPKLKDKSDFGLIGFDKKSVIIPANSNNYF